MEEIALKAGGSDLFSLDEVRQVVGGKKNGVEDDQEKRPPADPLVNLVHFVQSAEEVFKEIESRGKDDAPAHQHGRAQRGGFSGVLVWIGEPVLVVDFASEPNDQRGTHGENDGPHLLVRF